MFWQGSEENGAEMKMRRSVGLAVGCAGWLLLAGLSGCIQDVQQETFIDCSLGAECPEGTYCDGQYCLQGDCTPGEMYCDGSRLLRCEEDGSGATLEEECSTGVCIQGECGCVEEEDCGLGESCVEGLCEQQGGVRCGNEICGDGERCEEFEICEEGSCQTARVCRAQCDGAVCGRRGDLCCEGSTPVCGPEGECAPSCEGEGELCGENYDFCCDAGDLCVFGDCRTPGRACEGFLECDFGEYCDLGLGFCMPDEFPEGLVCEIEYDFDEFEPDVLWHWRGVEIEGTLFSNVMMTPMVADLTGNGVPNVAFNAYDAAGASSNSYPVVIDGATGETLYVNTYRQTQFGTQLALVDITGNGLPEIVAARSNGIGVIRDIVSCPDPEEDPDGCYLWWNDQVSTSEGSPVVADVTANGEVEVVLNETILRGLTGEVLAVSPSGGYDYTVVADITGDGRQEFLAGGCLYAVAEDGELDALWCNEDLPGGSGPRVYVAIGDVAVAEGRAGLPEFVLTGDGNVYVVAAESGVLLHEFVLPGGGLGGSPIIADFDGDGTGEFGIAGQGCYTVFDLSCLGPVDEDLPGCERPTIEECTPGVDCFDVQACPDLAESGGTGDGILWSVFVQDLSSSRTGSSVFDFQGNGRKEVVYNDECLLMVFDGRTGAPQFRFPNTNRTSSEYPIIVDVNGDGRTNIVVSANNDRFSRDCEDPIQERPDRYPECHGDGPHPAWCTEGTFGVIALQDPEDSWVRTRPIWNQFAYHIDNAGDQGQAPTSPVMPWETHNTFRANRQGEVPLNSADVVVSSVQANTLGCPPEIAFQVTIRNLGKSAIPAGLPVSLYNELLGGVVLTVEVEDPISPGGTAVVSFSYRVPASLFNQPLDFEIRANDDGSTVAVVNDCNPETATSRVEALVCPYVL